MEERKDFFDIVKPQEADVFSRYNKMMKEKQKEPELKKAEPQVYRGGPWKCSSCGSRQGGEARVCTLCGGLQPAMAAPELKKHPRKKLIRQILLGIFRWSLGMNVHLIFQNGDFDEKIQFKLFEKLC